MKKGNILQNQHLLCIPYTIYRFNTLIFDLKTDRVSECLISFGREFHMTDPKCLNELFPLQTLFTDGITRSCWDHKLKS